MSYCRFSNDSDVYVYHTVFGGWDCCGCRINSKITIFKSRRDILRHLIKHLKLGHRVPSDAILRLIREIEQHKRKKEN